MAFSVDVQDLFYYLPHEKLLQFVQSCIVVYNDMWAGKGNSLSRSPVPSDIFVSTLDKILDWEQAGLHEKVHRHVDDYLIFTQKHGFEGNRHRISEVFEKSGCGLFFTSDVPVNGQIQFLDLSISDPIPVWPRNIRKWGF